MIEQGGRSLRRKKTNASAPMCRSVRQGDRVKRRRTIMVGLVVVVVGIAAALALRNRDDSSNAEYCAALGATVGGATDEEGRQLDEFDEDDRRRSYLRVARLAPSEVRDEWRRVAETFTSAEEPVDLEAERRAIRHAEATCGLKIETL
jgi:hypothetical protein